MHLVTSIDGAHLWKHGAQFAVQFGAAKPPMKKRFLSPIGVYLALQADDAEWLMRDLEYQAWRVEVMQMLRELHWRRVRGRTGGNRPF